MITPFLSLEGYNIQVLSISTQHHADSKHIQRFSIIFWPVLISVPIDLDPKGSPGRLSLNKERLKVKSGDNQENCCISKSSFSATLLS